MTTEFDNLDAFLASSELDEVSSNKFRLKNKRLHLTYRGHIEYQKLVGFLESLQPVKYYSIVHEMGIKTSYLHTHCLVEFNDLFERRSPRCLDYQEIHPNIKKVTAQLHWDRVLEYHKKDGTPFTNIQDRIKDSVGPKKEEKNKKREPVKASEVFECQTLEEAVLKFGDERGINVVPAVTATFRAKPKQFVLPAEPPVKWRPWQQELFEELKEPCKNNRTIVWYYDRKGDAGKTVFSRHMDMYHGAFMATHADTYHTATQLQARLAVGAPMDMVLINIPRAEAPSDWHHNVDLYESITFEAPIKRYIHKKFLQLYAGLEELKDGTITSKKNIGRTMHFNSPHVVVFANFLPHLECLSENKWEIRYLEPSGMNVYKVYPEKRVKDNTTMEDGYYIPGTILHIAEPDPIITPDPETTKDSDDYFSSVSSPGRSKPFKYDSEKESIMAKSAIELVRKKRGDEEVAKMLEKLKKQKEEKEEMTEIQKKLMAIKPKRLQQRPAYSDASSQ